MTEPAVSRPNMRQYGVSRDAEGLLPWSWAVDRLTGAHNYWIGTTHPSGAPHLTAVWGIWLDDLFYFSCANGSRKARNLARNARCTVAPERGDEAVIVEGDAAPVRDAAVLARFKQVYDKKYDWDMDVSHAEGFFVVRPRTAFGFIEHPGQFAKTATRWTFEDTP